MDPLQSHRFAENLINWYWQFGVKRTGDFYLNPADWLNRLYSVHTWMQSALPARQQERPAMAIWGPSQTGKSTSISAYIDGKSPLTGKLETEGEKTGLHWPGGIPFRFMAPLVDNVDQLPNHIARRVLNPFNKGADGSSCLTRFTAGSLKPEPDRYHVRFPEFPVGLHLVSVKDLWHAIARGYGSECSGPNGRQTRWDLPRFRKEIDTFKKQYAATLPRLKENEAPIERDAFEKLRDFVEILEDLAAIEEKDSNFYDLSTQKEEWQATLRALLQEPVLLRSAELTEIFVSRILWDGLESITTLYRGLTDVFDTFYGRNGDWKDKPVYCSLEAAALFLNMSAPGIALNPTRPNPASSEGHIFDMIQNLQWIEEDGAIQLGCDPKMQGTHIGTDPVFFSNLQSLVWELTVPINVDNLNDQPFDDQPDRPNAFKEFIKASDLLDFAGVGNDKPSEQIKLVADQNYLQKLKAEGNMPPPESLMTPISFLSKVLKRGKTASIVATYAKRLNIDGFSIFQGVRGQPCPNAGQLIQGIEFWWKYNLPEFYKNPRGKCPRPLNLSLTWWSQQLNYADDPLDQRMYDGVKRIVESLGVLRDPEIVNTFAIHYHTSPDKAAKIVHDFTPGSTRYQTIWSIKDFKHQFSQSISKQSFDAMVTDMETGGAELFFMTARDQMLTTRAEGQPNRLSQIDEQLVDKEKVVSQLLSEPNLIPQEKPKDTRRDHLVESRTKFKKLLTGLSDEKMKELNFLFRDLFSIKADILDQPPANASAITENYIIAQYRLWVQDRLANFNPSSIGLADQEALKRFLNAIVESIKPDLAATAEWLKNISGSNQLLEQENRPDLRPHIAIMLSNIIIKGPRTKSQWSRPTQGDQKSRKSGNANGGRYYSMFLEPLIGESQRLDSLIDREIVPIKRTPQAGDDELFSLTKTYSSNT